MFALGLTTMEAPVPAGVPPHEPTNHSSVPPLPPTAVKVTELPAQMGLLLAVIEVGALGGADTLIVMLAQLDGAHGGLSHRA